MTYAKFVQIVFTMFVFTTMIFDSALAQDVIDDKEKEAINKLIEDYIMDNPEVILKSIEEMRKRQQREVQEAAK